MSTSAEIVAGAMRRLKLLSIGETPSADDAEVGLAALNGLLSGLTADGINVSPDIPLDAKYEEGVIAMLAVRMADDFGTTPGPAVVADARRGRNRLRAAYIVPPLTQFDLALVLAPARPYVNVRGITAWTAATAYVVGDQVTNAGNIYQCTTAGTSSASGGPTGVNSSITDGTVVWSYTGTI